MQIIDYAYRKPSYLEPLNTKNINAIAIHHTGNDNVIDTNTDYHMDVNGWQWNGYGFVIEDGVIYKVRGYEFKNAAVKHYNDRVISIAVKGNYDRKIPSQADIEACQWLIDYLKSKVPSIDNVHGHNFWNQTSCPGKLFPIKSLRINKIEYVTKKDLEEEVKKLNDKLKFLEKKVLVLTREHR